MTDNCIFFAGSKTSSRGKVNKTVIEITKAFPLGAAITAINFEMTRLHCFLHYLNPRITFRGNPLRRKLVFAIFMYFNVISAGLKEIIRSIMAGMSPRWFNVTCYTVSDAWSIIFFSLSLRRIMFKVSFGTGNLLMVNDFWLLNRFSWYMCNPLVIKSTLPTHCNVYILTFTKILRNQQMVTKPPGYLARETPRHRLSQRPVLIWWVARAHSKQWLF